MTFFYYFCLQRHPFFIHTKTHGLSRTGCAFTVGRPDDGFPDPTEPILEYAGNGHLVVETGDRIGRLVLRPVAGDHPAAGNIPEQAVPIPGTLPAGHARHRGSYPHGHAGHIAAVRKTVAHTGIRRSRVSDHHVYDMPTDRQHRTDDQQGTPA